MESPISGKQLLLSLLLLLGSGCLRAYPPAEEDTSSSTPDTSDSSASTSHTLSTGEDSECTNDCPDNPICGDGIVAHPESCDDGNPTPGDGCEPNCTATPHWPCGDGACKLPEDPENCPADCPVTCDDGRCDAGENAITCPADCTASCGQGVCEPGETPETCMKDCPAGSCPNNICDPDESPEDCDDCEPDVCENHLCEEGEDQFGGPEFCPDDCPPVCGDGAIWGDERCDDGNTIDLDTCSADCRTPARYVFISSLPYTGNLGGVAKADENCQTEAKNAKAEGVYRAWLSDARSSPSSRFDSLDFEGWYLLPGLVEGKPIGLVKGWKGLSTQTIVIDRHADGELLAVDPPLVWTNTKSDGVMEDPTNTCDNWHSKLSDLSGNIGDTSVPDVPKMDHWTNTGTNNCSKTAHLYCFQVSP